MLSNYEACTNGEVRSLVTGRLLDANPRPGSKYRFVSVEFDDGCRKIIGIHVLIVAAFIPFDPTRLYVDHISRDRLDNSLSNLRRVNYKENAANRSPCLKPRPIRPVMQFEIGGTEPLRIWKGGVQEAARELGIHRNNIYMACVGKIKTSGSYQWQYVPQEEPQEESRQLDVDGVIVTVYASGWIKTKKTLGPGNLHESGYYQVHLNTPDGKSKHYFVHKLVCRAFHGEAPVDKPHAYHLVQSTPHNNAASNLAWGSEKDACKTRKALPKGIRGIPIDQLTRDDVWIATYPSIEQASRETGIIASNIGTCCKGKVSAAGGYKWKYHENVVPNTRERKPEHNLRAPNHSSYEPTKSETCALKVICMDKQGNELQTYPSITQAALETNADASTIAKCCKGKVRSAGGYTWKYA